MRRGIVTAVLVFICFILQTSVFELIKLAGIAPNILLIFISSIAVMRGQKPGMIVGFFSWAFDGYFFMAQQSVDCFFIYDVWFCRWIFFIEFYYSD